MPAIFEHTRIEQCRLSPHLSSATKARSRNTNLPTWRECFLQFRLAVDSMRPDDLRKIAFDTGKKLARIAYTRAVVATHGSVWNTGCSCYYQVRVSHSRDTRTWPSPSIFSRPFQPMTQYSTRCGLLHNWARTREFLARRGDRRRRPTISVRSSYCAVRSIITFICHVRYERLPTVVLAAATKTTVLWNCCDQQDRILNHLVERYNALFFATA